MVRQSRETALLLPGPLLLSVLLTGLPSLSPLSSILWRCCSIPVTSPLSQEGTGAVTSRCKASPILSKGRKKEQAWGGSHPSKPMRKKRESKASWEGRLGVLHPLCHLKFGSSFSTLLLPAQIFLSCKGKRNHSGPWYLCVPGASSVEMGPVTDPVIWFCSGVL